MSDHFDAYLQQVARSLRSLPADVRDEELREMRVHLEHLQADFISQGRDSEQSAQLALGEFGAARAVGTRLRDVWEGHSGGWRPVLKAFGAGLLFWMGAVGALSVGVHNFYSWSLSALFPLEADLVFKTTILLIPFLTGAIHARFLGRRAWLISAGVYLPLWMVEALTGSKSSLTLNSYSLSFWAWSVFWGVLGANLTALWLRHRRYALLAVAGASGSVSSMTIAPPRVSRRTTRWKWPGILLAPLALAVVVKWRLDAALHPRTALDAVHTRLLLSRDATRLERPDPISLDEKATSAEVLAGTRRVYFKATLRATKEYQKLRQNYLQKQLASPLTRARYGEKHLRASLRRVQTNAFVLEGTAVVKQTPDGWRVDEESYDWSRMRGWIEDIYYEK